MITVSYAKSFTEIKRFADTYPSIFINQSINLYWPLGNKITVVCYRRSFTQVNMHVEFSFFCSLEYYIPNFSIYQ